MFEELFEVEDRCKNYCSPKNFLSNHETHSQILELQQVNTQMFSLRGFIDR